MVGGFIGLARGGTFINLVNCLFDPKSVDIHESHYHSTFLAVNDSYRNKRTCTHYVKKNCFRKKKFGEAEGEDASDWTNSQLLARLGRGWHEVGGKVVPDRTMDFYAFKEGSGTEASPFLISSSKDWEGLAYNISIGANYGGKFFRLTSDITLKETFTNGIPATMLGVGQGISFRGTFDGDGHTITLDLAFMTQCVRFYLSLKPGSRRIMPPMNRIERREQMAALGRDFRQWADDYFAEGSGHLDCELKAETVLADFNQETRLNWPAKRMTQHLSAYCQFASHISCLNPISVTHREKDGERWVKRDESNQPKTYYYVQSAKVEAEAAATEPVQSSLPFESDSSDEWIDGQPF